jgi:hypothetical protein
LSKLYSIDDAAQEHYTLTGTGWQNAAYSKSRYLISYLMPLRLSILPRVAWVVIV